MKQVKMDSNSVSEGKCECRKSLFQETSRHYVHMREELTDIDTVFKM